MRKEQNTNTPKKAYFRLILLIFFIIKQLLKVSLFCLQAVCCSDGFHCCPQGTTCDFVTLTCKSNSTSVPMSVLIPASAKEEQRKHEEVKVTVGKYGNRVPCDAQTSCPDYTTCCLIAKTNKWGCCPLPNVSLTLLHIKLMFISANHS